MNQNLDDNENCYVYVKVQDKHRNTIYKQKISMKEDFNPDQSFNNADKSINSRKTKSLMSSPKVVSEKYERYRPKPNLNTPKKRSLLELKKVFVFP